MENLAGKTAFVSGASQGIGRACAIALAKMGAQVALAARNEAKLEAIQMAWHEEYKDAQS